MREYYDDELEKNDGLEQKFNPPFFRYNYMQE